MPPSIYLINPDADFSTYHSAEVYAGRGFEPATLIADLAVTTLAAMMPADFECRLCDENISPIDFDTPADFIGLTGKVSQSGRMVEIAKAFRRRGKVVLIGGPYASLCPDLVRPHCDILVQGETEDIFEELCSDLRQRCWKTEYIGGRPDLAHSPLPRWGLYANERALMGAVQTARGCPFECEFCDVIQYVGRNQRHKPVPQVLSELDELYRCGYRAIYIADDNFTVYRARAKELLSALRDWNLRQEDGRVHFSTQVSIDAARDDQLLELCAEAGLIHVFIGIETPNEASLRETKKRQNVGIDLVDQVQRFVDHGITVTGGMIVGFDSDGLDIFERQYEFAMSTPIPVFSLGALVAPRATPLYRRMAQEGRLLPEGSEVASLPWSTNMIPRQMTHEQLLSGIRRLCNRLYHPAAFGERVLRLIERLGRRRDPRFAEGTRSFTKLRPVDASSLDLLSTFVRSGPDEAAMWSRIRKGMARRPEAGEFVLSAMLQYVQIRYMYEETGLWNPGLNSDA